MVLDGSILLWIATDKEITKNITQRRNVRESAPIPEKNGKKSLICYPEFSVLKSHQAIMWQLFQLPWKLDGFGWFHFALDCNRQRDYKEYYPAQKC